MRFMISIPALQSLVAFLEKELLDLQCFDVIVTEGGSPPISSSHQRIAHSELGEGGEVAIRRP
jgi:hypothetical protein